MKTDIYWIQAPIPGDLGIMARPRGGDWLETEIKELRHVGVHTFVSLLEYFETAHLDLQEEAALAQRHGLEFISFPITDRDVPQSKVATRQLIKGLLDRLAEGKKIVIHCRMGIGRSSLIAAAILLRAIDGIDAEQAFRLIEESRGLPVPDTPAQRQWVAYLEY